MDLNLNNKCALVFGGSKGIGLAIARGLLREGANVCIVSRSSKNLDLAVKELEKDNSGNLVLFQGDIGNVDSFSKVMDFMKKNIGPPNIVINNSGGPEMGSYNKHSEEVWMNAFQNHFLSLVRILNLFTSSMKKERWGRIINISSSVVF